MTLTFANSFPIHVIASPPGAIAFANPALPNPLASRENMRGVAA